MIEATIAMPRSAASQMPAGRLLSRQDAADQRSVPGRAPETRTAERVKQITASGPSFEVRLDGKTMRLYSELRDPETDRVLMRLPGGYLPSEEEGPAMPRLSAEA